MLPGEAGESRDWRSLAGGGVGPVVVVVDPCWQSFAAGGIRAVEAGVGAPLGQGAVEPFDLAVGPGSVGRCVLRCTGDLGEGLSWSLPSDGFAGAAVELEGDLVAVGLGEVAHVAALGPVLAQKAVGVLVGAALPG